MGRVRVHHQHHPYLHRDHDGGGKVLTSSVHRLLGVLHLGVPHGHDRALRGLQRHQPSRVRSITRCLRSCAGVRIPHLLEQSSGCEGAQRALHHTRIRFRGSCGVRPHLHAAAGQDPVVGPIPHTARPHLRLQVHPHHCICIRASADHMDVILLRSAHLGPTGSCRPLRNVLEHHRWWNICYIIRNSGLVLRRRYGPSHAHTGPYCLCARSYRPVLYPYTVLSYHQRAQDVHRRDNC